nr:hypothetical protein [Tanacetum cinerariifolium]
MALPSRDQRLQYLRFEGLEYTNTDITYFEERLGRIYCRGIHMMLVLDFDSLSAMMSKRLTSRMLMEHRDDQGQSVVTSRAWRRLFEVQGPFVFKIIMEFFSTFRFSEAPEKVTVTNLFYLRGMDVGSVNIPYLVARYLRVFALGRKRRAMISGDLLVINMAELVRLQICEELDDTWSWVALGPEKQHVAAVGAPKVAKGALDVDEGDQVVSAPIQAPQLPAAEPTRTMK